MAKLAMIVFAIVVCMMVVAPHAEGGITCGTVLSSLLPCKNYLRQGGALPSSCCDGARSLYRAANTADARRTACQCMKILANAYKVNPRIAAAVPSKCNVNIGYAASYSTDCNKVH